MTRSIAREVLAVLDACCRDFTFPMLDNGYVYLAATRLSLFRSPTDWAMVIEVFGFSPREGTPSLSVSTFASRLHARDPQSNYASVAAYRNYLAQHPHDDSRFFYPVDDDGWADPENREFVAPDAKAVSLRGRACNLPTRREYVAQGIELEDKRRVRTYELVRYLAATERELVLASASERRVSVLPEMRPLLVLDEWAHPDVVAEALPSQAEAFTQLARVLETGDAGNYRPTESPNTHWRNWPEGGTL